MPGIVRRAGLQVVIRRGAVLWRRSHWTFSGALVGETLYFPNFWEVLERSTWVRVVRALRAEADFKSTATRLHR